MDKRLVQDFKNSWRNCNAATAGFLAGIPADRLLTKAFESRFTTFAWEFACVVRTRLCYIDGFKTGKLEFSDREGVLNKEVYAHFSKAEMSKFLSTTSNEVLLCLETIDGPEGVRLAQWLLQHERLHQGKLMLYAVQAGFDLPESFIKTWGEGNFKKHR